MIHRLDHIGSDARNTHTHATTNYNSKCITDTSILAVVKVSIRNSSSSRERESNSLVGSRRAIVTVDCIYRTTGSIDSNTRCTFRQISNRSGGGGCVCDVVVAICEMNFPIYIYTDGGMTRHVNRYCDRRDDVR